MSYIKSSDDDMDLQDFGDEALRMFGISPTIFGILDILGYFKSTHRNKNLKIFNIWHQDAYLTFFATFDSPFM